MKAARKRERNFALRDLLHPAKAFQHPSDVVRDPDLTPNEKRAILASWASDWASEAGKPIALSAVLEALSALDQRAHGAADTRLRDWRRRQARRQAIERFRNRRGDGIRRVPQLTFVPPLSPYAGKTR